MISTPDIKARFSTFAVETQNLTKKFGELTAVNQVNLSIDEREIFGLIGPNGAGKTTLIRMLTTIVEPSEGSAKIFGLDVRSQANKVRESIGVVAQAMTLDIELTAMENVDLYAKFYGIPQDTRRERVRELLKLVGLSERSDYTVASYSGGMKRRLELIRSLVHRPHLLILDEPTTGLDPQARIAVWDYLRKLHKEEGITILLTTHHLEEAESLCDRVAIMDYGKVIAVGSPSDLKRQVMGGDAIDIDLTSTNDLAVEGLKKLDIVRKVSFRESGLTLLVDNGSEAVPRIIETVNQNGGKVKSVTLREPTLDDVFLHFTGRSIREDTIIKRKRWVSMSMWGGAPRR